LSPLDFARGDPEHAEGSGVRVNRDGGNPLLDPAFAKATAGKPLPFDRLRAGLAGRGILIPKVRGHTLPPTFIDRPTTAMLRFNRLERLILSPLR